VSATEAPASRPRGAPPDDRVLAATRVVALAILPFLVVAAFLLVVFPERTGELFAWAIAPPLSAWFLASAYVGGIWFFVRVARARAWHHVRRGFPAVVVFAGALLVATLLHLDRFSHNLSFVVWMILYATTPFVVAAVAIVQRRHDPRTPDDPDVVIPRAARTALVAIGVAAFAAGVLVFAAPQAAASLWAWQLTPLTAQVTGAVLSLTGVVSAGLVVDARWSAFRAVFQAQLVSLAAIAISLGVRHDDLLWDRPLTAAFVALVAVAIVVYAGFTVWCDARLRAARRGARAV
jgi:MFS family permease